jgi:hypothetical protein
MPWQWSTVRGVLSLQEPNEYGERVFTHRDVTIECTRQQGKTLIVVLLILFHLFVAPVVGRARPHKIVYTAQRWSTAKDVFNRVVKVINRVPWLKRRLARNPSIRDNHGVIEVALRRDRAGNATVTAVAEFAPRSQEFGRGITELDILFLDEAYDLDPGIENDLTGAQAAALNPQTIYLSTPPVFLKHPKCHSLADMHRLGHAEAPDLFYQLFAAPREMSRDDPATWALAQPSYGVATDEREVRSKRQKAKTAVKRMIFDADYCGWGDYPPPEVEGEGEIAAEDWNAMGNPGAQLVGPQMVVLYRSPEDGPWAIVAAQRTREGRVHLEVGYPRPDLGSVTSARVVRMLVDLVAEWGLSTVVVGRGAAAEVQPELEAAGVEVLVPNRTEEAQACGGFLNDARARLMSHGDHRGLNEAVAGATKRDLPSGGFVWELAEGAGYAQLMGATLARWALLKFAKPLAKMPAKPAMSARATETAELDLMRMEF